MQMSTPEQLSRKDARRAYFSDGGGVIFSTLGIGVKDGQVSAFTRLLPLICATPCRSALSPARAEVLAGLPKLGKSRPSAGDQVR
jgi:hypothetical protein